MLHAELKVVGGKQNNQVVPLPQGKFLIGREQDCQLRPNSELVSRHHCVFSTDEFGLRVRDLGSTNGTFVNGQRIEKQVELKAGDRVAIGTLNFEVVVREAAPVAVNAGEAPPEELPEAPPAPVEADPALENTEAGSETVFNMPAVDPEATPAAEDTQQVSSSDTAMLPQPPPAQAPGYPPQQPPPPQYAPPPIQYPPGYNHYQPQPMYPPQYPGMQYPPPMPGYGMPQPPMQMPPQQQAPPPVESPTPAPEEMPDVSLPKPSETGLKEEADAKGSGGSSKNAENPSGSAGDIIKQYIQRRPS